MFKMNKLFKKINYEKKHQRNKNLDRRKQYLGLFTYLKINSGLFFLIEPFYTISHFAFVQNILLFYLYQILLVFH